jgi:hypothetical protein
VTRPLKLVLVEWVDSSAIYGWKALQDVEKEQNLEGRSVGWILHRSRKQITIVSSLTHENEENVATQGSGIHTIPMCAVTRIRRLYA